MRCGLMSGERAAKRGGRAGVAGGRRTGRRRGVRYACNGVATDDFSLRRRPRKPPLDVLYVQHARRARGE
eukprot:31452-Pelagococcus_subviridis.AAC.3